jgi:DNA-binding PadR family transcriptional regulator
VTNSELAILSLIAERPRHGYEIEQVIEARGMRNWTEVGFSSIYYVLGKLEKEGWIESQLESPSGRGPARKVHRITPLGQEALHGATAEALSTPTPFYNAIWLGLSNLPLISREEAIEALNAYHRDLLIRSDDIRQSWEALPARIPYHVEALFDLSTTLLTAELGWISAFIRKLEQKKEGKNDENRP